MSRTSSLKVELKKGKEIIFTPTFAFLTAALLLGIVSMTSLLVTLPLYLKTLGGDEAAAGIANGIFTIFAILPRPIIGKYIDQRGRKSFLLSGILVFTAAAFVYPFLDSITAIYLIRAVQGMGWGTFFVSCYALSSDIIPDSRRTEALGYLSSAPPLGMALGPLFGETLLNIYHFQYAFLASGFLALAAFIVTILAKENPWEKKETSSLELVSRHALPPSINIFLIAITLGAVITFIPLMGEAREITNVGMFFTLYGVIVIALRPLGGKAADRYGYFSILFPSMICLCVSMIGLSFTYSFTALLISGVLFGLGLSMTIPVLMSWCLEISPASEKGKALATFTSSIDLGIGTGSLGLGFILVTTSYAAIYLICAAVIIISLLLLLSQKKLLLKSNNP